ncbi:MAG: acyltransferase [Chloroherpetonaceae bacterium]|nr:acyltransferase [Chloroherpetonaceae bacterium]
MNQINKGLGTGSGYLEKLDVLRGIAILSVVAYHFHGEWFYERINKYDGWWLNTNGYTFAEVFRTFFPTSFGWAGVELFFVISGFVIHYGYLQSGKERPNWIQFFNKRFWRIYPPYLFSMIFFALLMEKGTLTTKDFWSHVFMVHNFSTETFFGINASYWSLGVEMQFYLLYPLALYIRSRVGIKGLLAIGFVIHLGFGAIGLLMDWHSLPYDKNALKVWILWLMGCAAAEFYLDGKRIFPNSPITFWTIFLLFFPLKAIWFSPYITDLYISAVSAFGIELYLNSEKKSLGFVERKLSEIGICSYSMYLLHYLALITLTGRFQAFGLAKEYPWLRLIDGVILFGAVFLLSRAYYDYVEIRSIEWGKAFYEKVLKKLMGRREYAVR